MKAKYDTCRVWKGYRYEEIGSFNRRPGTCRKSYTIEQYGRFIVPISLRNCGLNAVKLNKQLRELLWTVRRRSSKTDLPAKTSATGPELIPAQRLACLGFARDHPNWTLIIIIRTLFCKFCYVCIQDIVYNT